MKMKFDIFQSLYRNNLILLYPNKPLLSMEKTKFQWQSILKFLKSNSSFLIQTVLLSIFILFYAVVTSFYGEYMLKNLQINQKDSYFLFLFCLFFSLTFLKITSEFFRTRLFLWIEKKIDIMLSEDTFCKILSLPYRYYYNHTTGDILSRIQALDDVKVAISKWIMVMIVDIPLMMISMICLFILQDKLALLVFLFFLIQFLILKIFQSSLEEKIEECEKGQAELATIQVETIRSFETMKGLSLEKYFEERWLREKVIFLSKMHRLEKWVSLENYGKELCQETSSLVLLLFGCLFVKQGSLTFATLLTIENLALYFFNPVREFIDLDQDTKRAKTAWRRISVFSKNTKKNGYLTKIEGQKNFKSFKPLYFRK
jgi:ABC-type bacteriocin/lantibiotic exporter with double-glycine peptidase domain